MKVLSVITHVYLFLEEIPSLSLSQEIPTRPIIIQWKKKNKTKNKKNKKKLIFIYKIASTSQS
jgi:hypothetical protein